MLPYQPGIIERVAELEKRLENLESEIRFFANKPSDVPRPRYDL